MSVLDYVTVFVGLCDRSESDYVAGLCRIMWQVCVRLCGSFVSEFAACVC